MKTKLIIFSSTLLLASCGPPQFWHQPPVITLTVEQDGPCVVVTELHDNEPAKSSRICPPPANEPKASSIIKLIDPCGDAPGINDELLLNIDGHVVASFSANAAGDLTRLSELAPDTTYMTTDGSNCVFQLDKEGKLK